MDEKKTIVLFGEESDSEEDKIFMRLIEEPHKEPVVVKNSAELWAAELLQIDWVMTKYMS